MVPAASIGNLAYTPPADANGTGYASFTFKVSDGTDESAVANTMTIDVTPGNDPATGEPTITGTAQVGQTLTAVTTGILDADGLTSPTYTYQWIRVDGTEDDIAGENSSTYTLDSADLGKTIKVRVSFDDDGGNTETLTSAATATVTAAIILPGSAGLVSNLNQLATSAFSFGSTVTRRSLAQGFTTGATTGGYTLTSIEVAFSSAQSATHLGNLMAGVWSDDGSGNPNAELFTLTKPTNIVAATSSGGPITLSVTGNYTVFTAPPDTTLNPSTSYHMVLKGGSGNLWSTAIDDETGATGWSIADVGHRKQTAPPPPGNWTAVDDHHAASNAMLIRVNGTTGGGTTTSSDATLSALALADAADDTAITINPVFASGTASYTASVVNRVDVITIDPTVNESNATIEYLDSSDTEIADADSGKAGQQVSLVEGANTINVKVTAQDTTTTSTYTVVVTRNTAPTADDNTVTTDEDTDYAFTADDFGFADADGDTLASVKIVTLPVAGNGTLELSDTPVVADEVVPEASIGNLVYIPPADANGAGYASFTFKVSDGTDESADAYTMTIDVTPGNDPATGAPTITGTAQVDQTLTAVTTGILDADGLTSSTYTYQWIRVNGTDVDITDADSSTYTLVDADLGTTIKVKVSFTDDGGNTEMLTSAETATVAAAIILPGSAGLVSNLNQVATDNKLDFGSGATEYSFAQGFTTGATTGGYTLTSIEVAFSQGLTTTQIGALTVSVRADDGSGNPATADPVTLTNPSSIDTPTSTTSGGSNQFHTLSGNSAVFTAPGGTTLNPSTQYFVVVVGAPHNLWSTGSDAQTGASDWSIANAARRKQTAPTEGSWAAHSDSHAMSIRVNGTTGGGTTNTAPTAADNTVTTGVGAAYTFTAGDFGFEDDDAGDTLASVKIVTVPAAGALALDGTAVVVDDVVAKAQIDGNMLTFTPVAGASGTGYATFDFKVNDGTDDSADAYTMTIDVADLPAITIAADRSTATGKMDWVRYTLNREGATADALTVTVTFAGPASNDWSLSTTKDSREVTFSAGSATAQQNILLSTGFYGIGFSHSATTSGPLTARLGAKAGYDTSDTAEVAVVVTSGPAWVIKLADDHNRFDEDGGGQDIAVVATAASAAIPAPSLDRFSKSALVFTISTSAGTADSYVDVDNPGDYQSISEDLYIPSSTCSADANAGNALVCRSNATFTPVDDAEVEPDETVNISLAQASGASPTIHLQGPGPDRTVSSLAKTYTITIVDDDTSSDATLSALALADASDDSAITISPVFVSGTTSYTASVDNGVDVITINPTVNESNATVEYLDSSDTAITDADSVKAGRQVSLSEGANTIKVKVTAQDAHHHEYLHRGGDAQHRADGGRQHGDDGRGRGVHLHGGRLRLRRRGTPATRWRA